MRYGKIVSAVAATAVVALAPAAQAMSLQAPPVNSDGSSKLVDPDEAIERMTAPPVSSNDRFRDLTGGSVEGRDAARSPVTSDRLSKPFR